MLHRVHQPLVLCVCLYGMRVMYFSKNVSRYGGSAVRNYVAIEV